MQGVGFRATVAQIASRYDVSGYVRNLDDGTVEVRASGSENQLDAFLSAIKTRFAAYIKQVIETETDSPRADQSGFEVRY